VILGSLNSVDLKADLEVAKDKNPLLYAGTKDNWKE
jgi:acetyl-CoA decarbonylase/synthase, CODH/ACS complex subunit gamma